MFKKTVFSIICIGLTALSFAQQPKPKTPVAPPVPNDSAKAKKPPLSITEKVKTSKKTEGLFTVYQDTANGSMQLFVKKRPIGQRIYLSKLFQKLGPIAP